MKFKIGDIIEVNYWGSIYTTHETLAKKLELKNWKYGFVPYKNEGCFYTNKPYKCKILNFTKQINQKFMGVRILEKDVDVILSGEEENIIKHRLVKNFELPDDLFKI